MKIGKFLPRPIKQLAHNSIYRFQCIRSSSQKAFSRAVTQTIFKDFSQAGETIAVREITKKRFGGIFVEIGANDGISVSTTYGLLKGGWSGWSIEANPQTYKRLVSNLVRYPKAKTMNLAVAPKRGTVNLYLGKDDPEGFYATLSVEKSEWFEKHRSSVAVEVEGIPLADFMKEQSVPKRFDLLMVDTEGMDLEILRTLDPSTHRPYLIVTEDYAPKNEEKFELLRSFGYGLDRRIGCNTFWIDQN